MQPDRYAPEDDGRGRFPASIKFAVPPDMPAQVKRAAAAKGVTIASFLRDAVELGLARASSVDRRAA